MRNIKLKIEYDGTNYCGWQIQKRRKSKVKSYKFPSIQEAIESALHKITREKIRLTASGRTDAGVHAQAQIANFKTDSNIFCLKLQKALNAFLPDDIVITKVEVAGADFHSRFAVKSKVYRYVILNRPYPSALIRNRAYFCPYPLNIGLMRKEAWQLLGRHDFKSFCASGSKVKDTIRTIKHITIKKIPYLYLYSSSAVALNRKDFSVIVIDIEADGFLYNMVRNIVGTLLEIGRGKFAPGSLKKIMQLKDRRYAGPTVPPYGLCLLEVKY